MAERVTLQTIADALGVSRTTVSNAYNRPDQLAPALRQKVLETAKQLGYAGPDPAARRLRSGRRGAIGLMFPERLSYAFTDPGAVGFLQGLTEAAEAAGYELLLLPGMRGERTEAGAVRDAVVGAFCLYCMPATHPAVQAAFERRLPVVLVDQPRLAGSFFIGIDDREGARLCAAHVAGLGHRRAAVIVDRILAGGRHGRERLDGYRAGLSADGALPVHATPANFEHEGARAAHALLTAPERPTALLCSTDVLALGTLRAARALGLDVPGDVSVTGFDDVPGAALAGLTTIRQPLQQKGREAGRLLLRRNTEREVILPLELVVRGSTAPPPG